MHDHWQAQQALDGSEDAEFGSGMVIWTEGSDDQFSRRIRSQRYWSKRKGSSSSKRNKSARRSGLLTTGTPQRRSNQQSRGDPRTYRTVCVRTCDGYFWPISFATRRKSFRNHERACKSSCNAPAKLFVYANPSQDTADMVDLNGRSYEEYPFAWLYQSRYYSQCKCTPHPWEVASVERHRMYARLQREGKLKKYIKSKSVPMATSVVRPKQRTAKRSPTKSRAAAKSSTKPAAKRRSGWRREAFGQHR